MSNSKSAYDKLDKDLKLKMTAFQHRIEELELR